MVCLGPMKRIWVIDESTAVRETLAIVLGREFEVVQRSEVSEKSLPQSPDNIDLLIFGLPRRFGSETRSFSVVASRVSCPVLFLLETKPTESLEPRKGNLDWLVKPFNPYELKAKIDRLMEGLDGSSGPSWINIVANNPVSAYLKYPYLPESTAALAQRFAKAQFPLLIIGEVGSGQEEVARAVCSLNPQAGPWVPVFLRDMVHEQTIQKFPLLTINDGEELQRVTLFIAGLECLDPAAQVSLLRYLEEQEESGKEIWTLSSSRVDLLERVYRGEFLDALYYRLATLTLKLPPLRERQDDLPDLVAQVSQDYSRRLNLGTVSYSSQAMERLRQYLWFGNLRELETVIATTLAVLRKGSIEADDLVWDPEAAAGIPTPSVTEQAKGSSETGEIFGEGRPMAQAGLGNGDFSTFRAFVNELAHELKNPMVTVKTFAQLLAERFDDSTFRTSFQDRVGSDIERMDDLVEALVEFSKLDQPNLQTVDLYGQLQQVLEELIPECVKRDTSIRWGNRGEGLNVVVDQNQFRCAFKNLVRTALGQTKAKEEIRVNVSQEGEVTLSFVQEEGGPVLHGQQLGTLVETEEESLPLRVLLARDLLERMGGDIEVNYLGQLQIQFKIVVPTPLALN